RDAIPTESYGNSGRGTPGPDVPGQLADAGPGLSPSRRAGSAPREPGTHRLAAYVVLSLLAGVRTEEARAITWDEVDLKADTVAVYRSVRVSPRCVVRRELLIP